MNLHSQNETLTLVAPIQPYAYTNFNQSVLDALIWRRKFLDTALTTLMLRTAALAEVAALLVEAIHSGHKALVAGNGGSAAEAQHFAAELVGRFKRERLPYAVLSLTTDTSILTAIANDYGYQDVFARQVCAFGQPGDVFIAFSTSGESENLLRAAQAGHERSVSVVAITGDCPSSLESLADITVRVPVVDTALVQEMHMMVTHVLCDIVEAELATSQKEAAL
ncbi:MAG: SIS domain-containing protein [Chloroflexi bacterium]|nr:MAG: SIS domain-containing protein [Chloroflexota bacterium]